MINEFKKIMLAGVGTAAITCEKLEDFINEMVKKGRLTVDEGKELSEELKRTVVKSTTEATNKVTDKLEEVKLLNREQVRNIISEYNFITKEEIDILKDRVRILEEKLNEKL